MKVYVVKAPQGEYEDYQEPIVKVFLDKKKAKQYVKEENAKLPLEQAEKCQNCYFIWENPAQKGDKSLSDIRVRNGLSGGQFNCMICWEKDVLPTLAAKLEYYDPIEKTKLSKETIRNAQTFPQDYDFGSELAGNVCYICGMSVPPIMIKRLVTRLIESGLFD